MDLHSFCSDMGFDADTENLLFPCWEKLCANTAAELPFFMKPEFYRKYYPLCQGPNGVLERMDEVARITASDPNCMRYAAMLHYGLYLAVPQMPLQKMPLPEKKYGDNAGIFQLLAAMSSLPLIAETQKAMGLPESQLAATAEWLGGTIAIYAAAHHGIPGHTPQQSAWLRHHIDGKLFRIGRLEYMPDIWGGYMPAVYRSRKTGALTVLSRDQWMFDSAGLRLPECTEKPAFTSRLKFLDGHVTGTPISPYGRIQTGRKVSLDLNEWEPLCADWDPVLHIHIPGGGGMSVSAVRESLLAARQFFRKYFSTDVKVFCCASWILNPVWEKELPDSNLAALQRNVYMTPAFRSENCGLFFVYGQDCDPRTQPRTSRLHEAFCRIYDRNEPLCAGCMFIPASDLEHFGTEYYRRTYDIR